MRQEIIFCSSLEHDRPPYIPIRSVGLFSNEAASRKRTPYRTEKSSGFNKVSTPGRSSSAVVLRLKSSFAVVCERILSVSQCTRFYLSKTKSRRVISVVQLINKQAPSYDAAASLDNAVAAAGKQFTAQDEAVIGSFLSLLGPRILDSIVMKFKKKVSIEVRAVVRLTDTSKITIARIRDTL